MSHKSDKCMGKPMLRWYSALVVFVVLLIAGCNSSVHVCQDCIDRVENVPALTTFEPLRSSLSTVTPIAEAIREFVKVFDYDNMITIIGDDGAVYRVQFRGVFAPEIEPVQPIEATASYVEIQIDGDNPDRSGILRASIYLRMPDGTEVRHGELVFWYGKLTG